MSEVCITHNKTHQQPITQQNDWLVSDNKMRWRERKRRERGVSWQNSSSQTSEHTFHPISCLHNSGAAYWKWENGEKILKTKIITHPPTTTKEVPELINPATLPLGLGKELYGMQRRDQIIFNHIISVYSGHTKHPATLNYATYEHRAVQSVILPEAMCYFLLLGQKGGGNVLPASCTMLC